MNRHSRSKDHAARCRWLLLPLLLLVLLAGSARQPPRANAFQLYVHENILQKALADKMSADALTTVQGHWYLWMIWGTGNQSSDEAVGQTENYLHFDSAKDPTDICERWNLGVDEPMQRALKQALNFVRYSDAGYDGGNTGSRDFIRQNALDAFGTVTHAVEDFYSHSNWVEYWQPSRITADTPFRTAPIVGTTCNPADFPSQIHTGYASLASWLYNQAHFRGAIWCPTDDSDDKHPIVLPPGYTDCHNTLAKDENKGYGATNLSDLGVTHVGWTLDDGTTLTTLFEAAQQLAIQSTVEVWKAFTDRAKTAINNYPAFSDLHVNADCVIKKLAFGPSSDKCLNSSCTGWNVAGSWTLALGSGGNAGPPSQPTLTLQQDSQGGLTGTVATDPDATAGQSKAGTTINGTISGSKITLNLPWYPMVPWTASDTLQPFTGAVSQTQIEDSTQDFGGWTMSGQAQQCTSDVPSSGTSARDFPGGAPLQALLPGAEANGFDLAITPATRTSGTQPPAQPDWTVPFQTSRGLIQLTPSGDTLTGSYDQGNGQIIAVARDNVLKGAWFHAPTYAPPNAGDFEFMLSDDNRSFSGRYDSASDGQWHTDWTGTQTAVSPGGTPPASGGAWPGVTAGSTGSSSTSGGSTSSSPSSGSSTSGSPSGTGSGSGGAATTAGVTDVATCVKFVQGVGLSQADATSACQAVAAAVPAGSSFGTVFACVYGKLSGGAAPATALSGCATGSASSPSGGATTSTASSGSSGGNPSGSGGSPSGGCNQWNVTGTWQIVQSNNYRPVLSIQQNGSTISGTVTLSADDQAKGNYVMNSGTLTGTLTGNQIEFTTSQMAKRDGSASQAQYTGTVGQGQITNGQAQDLLHPGSTATWSATGPTVCAGSGSSGSAAPSSSSPASQPAPSSGSGGGSGGGGNGAGLNILGFNICVQP